jgi:hypothetical protein
VTRITWRCVMSGADPGGRVQRVISSSQSKHLIWQHRNICGRAHSMEFEEPLRMFF